MKTTAPKGDVPHSDLPEIRRHACTREGFVESESRIEGSSPRENLVLWIGLLGTAIIWFIQLECNYALVPWTNLQRETKWGAVCKQPDLSRVRRGSWLDCDGSAGNAVEQGKGADRASNQRRPTALYGAGKGMLMSGLFFLLIFAQAIPHFFINPCLE